ncbi:MAG: lactonase family protein [Ginsengibacter sp.]
MSSRNIFFTIISSLIMIVGNSCQSSSDYYLIAGTYTKTDSKGIYLYHFNVESGEFKLVSSTESANNPSFIALAGNNLYAVNETGGENPGSVSAYSFDKVNDRLTFLNAHPSGGDAPCYITVSDDKKWVVVGNYSGGNFSVLPVNDDGSLSAAIQTIQHEGSGPNKDRQNDPHVHSTMFSPDNQYLLVTDLGLDKIMVYKFDTESMKPVSDTPVSSVAVTPGSGPRHIAFGKNGKFVYLVRELDNRANVFSFNDGELKQIQEVPRHPDGNSLKMDGAEVVVSPDNRFLYISNRGDENSLSIFSIDETTGKLKAIGYESVGGRSPRNFIIDPTGNFLLVANQNSNNITIFKRDKETGQIKKTDLEIEIPMPVFLAMKPK